MKNSLAFVVRLSSLCAPDVVNIGFLFYNEGGVRVDFGKKVNISSFRGLC